ncbi:MAG TPA: hypothetical protein VKV21_03810 [Solirubrobacteraceae bacterium]|nr:hypothetical protein [Solirubrobacteraceae bacterium]
MGRKILTTGAVVAAAVGVTAGPALASTTRHSFSNGTKLTAKQHALVASRMHTVLSHAAPTGTAHVINTGTFSECTVPEGHGAFQNFYTTDTTHYVEFGTGISHYALLIGTCTADLTKKQTSAGANDKPGGKKIIATPGRFASYSEACNIVFQGQDYIGDAESLVYASGEFAETCVVPVSY